MSVDHSLCFQNGGGRAEVLWGRDRRSGVVFGEKVCELGAILYVQPDQMTSENDRKLQTRNVQRQREREVDRRESCSS